MLQKRMARESQTPFHIDSAILWAACFLRTCGLILASMFPGEVLGAWFACQTVASPATKAIGELEEVVVTAKSIRTDSKDLKGWLRSLVGRYTYDGYVDLCGNGNAADQRPVTGWAECVGTRSTPAVHCKVNVSWTEERDEDGKPVLGGVSNLRPALVSFSLENRSIQDFSSRTAWITGTPRINNQTSFWGIMFMQVDNRGIAEWGSGVLVGDTFTSREACVGISKSGVCEKTTRITASQRSSEVFISVDIHIDSRRVLQQSFVLKRERSESNAERSGGVPP